MKDLRWLALFVLMALLVGCDLTRAAAPAPLVVSAQSTQTPHDPPVEPPTRERIPTGLKIEGAVPAHVLTRFYRLAYLYPDVANKVQRIVARKVVKGFQVSYEAKAIYVNIWYGEYILADKLTEQFAKRAFAQLQRQAPGTAKTFRTWKRFAAWLTAGVR